MRSNANLLGGAQRPYKRPAGATEVLLVRHGAYARGEEPGADAFLGEYADPHLNLLGRQQAELVAQRLQHVPFDAVFTSTMRRTVQTAAPLLASTGHAATALDDLREVHLGATFDGQEFERQRAAGHPQVLKVFEEERWDVLPGAESRKDFSRRSFRGLNTITETTGQDSTALAFVHAGVIAELCSQITGSRPFAFVASENTSITTVIRHSSGRWDLRSFNDTSHLQG